MSAVDQQVEERLARNYKVFEERFPKLAADLRSIGTPSSRIVWNGDQAVNIDIGGTNLYPGDAPSWTAGQLRGRADTMDRLVFGSPDHCNISGIGLPLTKDCARFLSENSIECDGCPLDEIEYSFVFGLGLGYHLNDLLSSEDVNTFIIIEPVAEFIIHSMSVIDWVPVIEKIYERGASLYFITADMPERAVRSIEDVVTNRGNAFLDGSYIYVHYYSWALKESYNIFSDMIKYHYITSGFYEDEVKMVYNTVSNFNMYTFRLLRAQEMLEQRMPVFIVGSGPSLDKDMAYIRKWSDRSIVVSCGTALGILLKSGIKPDIHVENENVDLVAEILSGAAEKYDLSTIRLMASTTVTPEIGKLFGSVWFYFRSGLSSTHLFGGREVPLLGAFPLVANAAFSGMVRLGFRTFYFFGCDCGARDPKKHHAEQVFYNVDYNGKSEVDTDWENKLVRTVPGNFGGTVRSAWHLDMSRRVFVETVRLLSVDVWNCSDGAKIEGFSPLAAGAIRLDVSTVSKSKILERVERQLPLFQPPDILRDITISSWLQGIESYDDALSCILEDLRGEAPSYRSLLKQVQELLSSSTTFMPIARMASATFESMIRYGAFVGTRIKDPDNRKAFFDLFTNAYEERSKVITAEIREFLEDMDEKISVAKKAEESRI
ncbi:motility associated factor glycosyltransferase family protein [Haematospirillum sp. H1815]|uniref:motility associated factor glycosyltransferase family protein n=1 Tax=Haematospirillum sp. H1815 TaxID=2723108 RepID=UPI001438A63E|nr:6-hydroxymethylpterin diphosphokinase MptE-like protein [Haematospirillum sp. H1815]NKD77635.1 motility associated factor glycosyltransferase family protein [Haematospirillum sp. H1815]